MNINFDRAVRHAVHADVMESRLGDETVILHLTRGIYFGLNTVGTMIWECLKAGDRTDLICARIGEAFDDTPETLEQDVYDILQQLLENELIEPR